MPAAVQSKRGGSQVSRLHPRGSKVHGRHKHSAHATATQRTPMPVQRTLPHSTPNWNRPHTCTRVVPVAESPRAVTQHTCANDNLDEPSCPDRHTTESTTATREGDGNAGGRGGL